MPKNNREAWGDIPRQIIGLSLNTGIGLGYKTLSMSAAAVPAIKQLVRSLNYTQVLDYMASAGSSSQTNIRQSLQEFAQANGVYGI